MAKKDKDDTSNDQSDKNLDEVERERNSAEPLGDNKKLSLSREANRPSKIDDKTKIIIGFFVTLFFSILGFASSYYLGAPRPRLDVVEIGLGGSNAGTSIEINQVTIEKSENAVSVPSLSKFESYDRLVSIEQTIRQEIEKIDGYLQEFDAWYRAYSAVKPENFDEHPMADVSVSRYFLSAVRSRDVDVKTLATDEKLEELKGAPRKIPYVFGKDEDGDEIFRIAFKNRVWQVGFNSKFDQDYYKRGVRVLAFSVVSLDFDLLKSISDETEKKLKDQKVLLIDMQRDLQEKILPNSTFVVTASLSNTGGSAFVVQPYLVLRIENPTLESVQFLLEPKIGRKDAKPFELTSSGITISTGAYEDSGAEVVVDSFLPDGTRSAHTIVSPSGRELIELVGTGLLGKEAETFLNLMRGDALLVSLSARKIDGRVISSSTYTFRSSLTKKAEEELLSEFDQ